MGTEMLHGSKYRARYDREFADIIVKKGTILTMGDVYPRYKNLTLPVPEEELPQWLELVSCEKPLYRIERTDRAGNCVLVNEAYGRHTAIELYIRAMGKYKTVLPMTATHGDGFRAVDDDTAQFADWLVRHRAVYKMIGSVWCAENFYKSEPDQVWRVRYLQRARKKTKLLDRVCDLTPHDVTLYRIAPTDQTTIYLVRKEHP